MRKNHVALSSLESAVAASERRREVNARSVPSGLQRGSAAPNAGLLMRTGDDEPSVGAALYDGRPAVFVQVNKLPGADTVVLTRRIEEVLRDLASELPAGGQIEPPEFRQATFVETSVRSVGSSMLIGSVLVIGVLLSFLRYGRLAAISLTAIPLSILTAGAVLIAFGASINGMTLGGLAIAVGEVVDDAIVDVENVWRRLRENAERGQPVPPLEVVRTASREVRSSVVFATMMMLAFLVDQVQQLCCALFQAVWAQLGSKRLLWERMRALFYGYHLKSMRELLEALFYGYERHRPILITDTS